MQSAICNHKYRTWFEWSFLTIGLVIQVVTYCLMPHDSWLSLVSGCLGVCSVCLAAQGRILTFVFGFGQVVTYGYLCLQAHLYAEVAINIYYFLTMIYGIVVWRRRMNASAENRVHTRRLPWVVWLTIISAIVILSGAVGYGLSIYTDDPTPYLDSFTTITSIAAQILLILAYRDQWFLWLAVDITSVVMWIYVGDYCMTAQYAFWCCNCLYGFYRWKSLE